MSNEGADIRGKERSRPCGKIPQIPNFLLSVEISNNLHVSNNASDIKYYDIKIRDYIHIYIHIYRIYTEIMYTQINIFSDKELSKIS